MSDGHVSLHVSEAHVQGDSGADPDLDAIVDARFLVDYDDWTPAETLALANRWVGSSARSWVFQLNTVGRLVLLRSYDGATFESTASAILGFATGTPWWVRWTFDPATGDVDFYSAPVDDPTNWTARGGGTGTASALFATDEPIRLGADNGPTNVDLYAAEFRSSIGGTVVSNPDFRTAAQTADNGATFLDDHGITWTLVGGATWIEPTTAGETLTRTVGPVIFGALADA